ncbi:hypothetical protein KIN20_037351 [Parelaphostrongylus tenuis]|uniref:Uncharacterized protein n=1 Tax=Parelaphostrongylus tenuis TaxID=148309 RepID=A0AAD5REG7_PARTN|nr:hypothetical protein KIN20_037351 [Parelaphostrongylus tenuis]
MPQGMFPSAFGTCTNGKQSALRFTGLCLLLTPLINERTAYIRPRRQNMIEICTTALMYCLELFAGPNRRR